MLVLLSVTLQQGACSLVYTKSSKVVSNKDPNNDSNQEPENTSHNQSNDQSNKKSNIKSTNNNPCHQIFSSQHILETKNIPTNEPNKEQPVGFSNKESSNNKSTSSKANDRTTKEELKQIWKINNKKIT